MQLKKLEAYGFKSFADKLDLEFGPGITAVVGPNGSGKSNITEAIRWVLGEQSAKNLRGNKMEDIIFVGSERRKPLGIAEVSLTLDNCDNKLPIEFSEVTITRRVFRSGESEFFINKVPCRLKDIYELFSDTGLGREALSVISQNQADEILNSRPEERRTIFEEAAGITKFKNRKREAVRRLDETKQNLLRIRDILCELETQIEPLSEGAEKAERYLALEHRFKELDIDVALDKVGKMSARIDGIRLQCTDLEDKLAASNAQLGKAEAERETFQYNLGVLENQCHEIETKVQELNTELQQLESHILLAEERTRNCREKKQRLHDDVGEFDAKISGMQQDVEREQAQMELLRVQLLEHRQFISAKEALAQELSDRVNEASQQVAASKDEVIDRMQLLAHKRNSLHSMRTEAEMARRTLDKLAQESGDNQQLLENTAQKHADCLEKTTVQRAVLDQTDASGQAYKKEHVLLIERQNRINLQGESIQKKLHGLTSRHKVLTDMQKAFEGYSHGVKAIMSKKDASWSGHICGIVADLLQVPAEYTLAVEVALGSALQNIIAEDAATAKEAIAYLKQSRQGRATLLPIDIVKASPPRDFETAAVKVSGALGFAADLVTFDGKYTEIMRFLLGRIIVAENMDAALNIARKAGFRSRIVTLEGDVISPGGAMTGGSHNKQGSGLLGRRRELEELLAEINEVQQSFADNRRQLQETVSKIEHMNTLMRTLQEQKQQLQIEIAGLEQEQVQWEQEKTRLGKMRQVLCAEMEEYRRTIDEGESGMASLAAEISALEASDRDTQEAIQLYQQDADRQQLALQQVTSEVTEGKIRLAAAEQEEKTAARMLEQLLKITSSYHHEKQEKQEEIKGIEQELVQLAEDAAKWRDAIAQLMAQRDEQANSLQQQKNRRYQIVADVNALEKKSKELRRANQDLQNKLHELHMHSTQYTFEFDTGVKYLSDNYGLIWEEHKARSQLDIDLTEAEATLTKWREELRAMGPVNMTAIEEYKRVCERFDFLRQQAEDLEQAQASLCQVIAEMDNTMRKQFAEAFQIICREFTSVFKELFGGGHAELQLTDKENVLETGIDIVVQPPGKKMQNLSMLSGGERAMTVISLLFAMLRAKPTPFCVVDEIDAALDEANVSRFAQFLRKLSQNSQFIVITHRKNTMEHANVLHGITMEEQGVSKMISVKFMEQAG